MTIICSVHSINASCRSRHSPLQKLPLQHFGVLRSGRCHRPHPAERGSGADLPACLPRCRLVEYTLSRSMSPTMVADYTLHRHNAPHAAEQTAAPMCVSDLCHSSTVSPPPTGGIGVRVLPASCVLVPKCYACAFLAQQEKPKTQPASHAAKKESSIIRSAQHIKPRISAPQIP